MDHGYWGPAFGEQAIRIAVNTKQQELTRLGCVTSEVEDGHELCHRTAAALADGRIVGWFQGRMEWGARALGNRSILADPRRGDMRDILNTKIKLREKFRPFAPSILEEALDEYFVGAVPDPFMIQVYPVRPEKRQRHPRRHARGWLRKAADRQSPNQSAVLAVAQAFEKITGVPVLLNTSFNENEPIVHQPGEALDCFLRTQMDMLVMGRFVIEKPKEA